MMRKIYTTLIIIILLILIIHNYNYLKHTINESILNAGLIEKTEIKNWYRNYYNEQDDNKKTIKVGIVDGMIDTSHNDLSETVIYQENFVSKVYENDIIHGTSIAGVIAGNNNNFGIEGISPNNIEIYNAIVMSNGFVSQNDVVKGINYCIENKVNIINISIEFYHYSKELKASLKAASDEGVVVFMANGNGIFKSFVKEIDDLKIDNVFFVGALNLKLQPSKYNLKGRKSDIYLPGEYIVSTSINNTYDMFNGTSYSTAIATGYFANLIKVNNKNNLQKNLNSLLKNEKRE